MAYPIETTATPKQATLQSALNELDPIIDRLGKLAQRAMACGDQIVGTRANGGDDVEKSTHLNHLIYAVQARCERIARIARDLEAEIQRIESGLGPYSEAEINQRRPE